MNVPQFAEFLKLQDYRVIKTKSCYWYTNTSRFFYQSFPYHRGINLSRKEIIDFFIKSESFAGKYLTYGEVSEKDKSIWICDNKNYDLSCLHQNARNKVRRGAERCKIEMVDFKWLESKGMPLIRDTLCRQNRPTSTITEGMWKKLCVAARRIPDFEAWGSFANGKLAAFIVLGIVEDYSYFLERYSLTEYLKYYHPNNVLTFLVTKEMFSSRKVKGVISGVEPFEELRGLNDYKSKMGFERKHLKQRVIVNPLAILFLNSFSLKIIENITSRYSSDYSRKMSGFIRFYRMQKQRDAQIAI